MITLRVPKREWSGDTPRDDTLKALDHIEALLLHQVGFMVKFVEVEQVDPDLVVEEDE